jgi:hypothetical protein
MTSQDKKNFFERRVKMAVSFTSGNDFIIPSENGQTYLGGAGDDMYILSGSTVGSNATIVIQDTEGANQIQLVGGLSITASLVTDNALELTLSNNAKIQILGADNFGYDVGGNTLGGVVGTQQDFDTFVTDTLGTTVPAQGDPPSSGGQVIIPVGGPGNDDPIDVDIDTAAFPTETDFDASGDAFNFIDDAAVSNYAVIDNFSADDTISFVNADMSDYAFSNEGEDVTLSYNYNDAGTMNVIELIGVVSSNDLVYDLASFTNALGFDAFG